MHQTEFVVLRIIIKCTQSFNFTDELTDAEKQLSEGGASAHELDKAKKKLEAEKEELVTALEVSGRKLYTTKSR